MRPKDAATLIIVRDDTHVLLGLRSHQHVFLPNRFVFPGGRVDAGDARVAFAGNLSDTCMQRLGASCSVARARGLAMAAVRETFEETGLLLGKPTSKSVTSKSVAWREFYARGFLPAIDKLQYLGRAITPVNHVRRFDARFFLTDARHLHGELCGNGELEDLQWVPLETAAELSVAPVTGLVLEILCARFNGDTVAAALAVASHRELFGKELFEFY